MPDPHVTIPDEDPIVQYSVGGTPDADFTIPFSFFDTTDILVYDDGVLVNAADYTVTGDAGTTGGYNGGTVTLDTPVTNSVITILRDVPAARTTDFPLSGPFNIAALNTQLDKVFAIQQQQNRIIDNAIKIPDTDASAVTTTLPAAATRASKVQAFDVDGNVTVSALTLEELEEQPAGAAASAAAAAASAAAALVSENNAETAETNAEAAQAAIEDIVDAYTGNQIVDTFSGTGAEVNFTLTQDPGSENNTIVTISGLLQHKGTYSVSGTTLTFSAAPASGTNNIEVAYGRTLPIGVPSDGSVTGAKLANDSTKAIAALTPAADRLPYYTSSNAAALATFTSAGRALLDDADAAAQRATLSITDIAIQTFVDKTSFTPTIQGISAAGVGTYTNQRGTYMRLGNIIFFQAYLLWTAHTGTGNARLAGLPVTSASLTGGQIQAGGTYVSNYTMTSKTVTVSVNNAATTADLISIDLSGGAAAALALDTAAELFVSGWYFV